MGTTNEGIYYIEATGEASTYIGRHSIMPNMPPVELAAAEYEKLRPQIEHYAKHGIIIVAEPGSRDAIVMADSIEREKERMETVYGGADENVEPDPVLRERGFSVPEQYAENRMASGQRDKIPTFATSPKTKTDDGDVDYKCVAVTARGTRCRNSAMGELLVCTVHNSSVKKGKTVKDSQGRKVSKDGKSFEAE